MSPHDIYLETQITTATPQRLRLMLVEGAIRRARLTAGHWRAGRNDEALESLIHCRAIVSELMAGVKDEDSELGKKVLGFYSFLFQSLTVAQQTRDAAALESAIRVLEEERQTWSQLCQQLPEAPAGAFRATAQEERAPASVSGGMLGSHPFASAQRGVSELSLDA